MDERNKGPGLAKPEKTKDKKFLAEIRKQRCVNCNAPPPNEAHHIKTVGSGGDDRKCNVLPLCTFCHSEWHSYGPVSTYRHRASFTLKKKLFELGWTIRGNKLVNDLYEKENS